MGLKFLRKVSTTQFMLFGDPSFFNQEHAVHNIYAQDITALASHQHNLSPQIESVEHHNEQLSSKGQN